MKQSRAKSALRIRAAHHRIDRAAPLFLAAAILLLIGARPGQAWAEPIAIPPASASTSWERFDPTLELPRIYNPDGSLPPNAEMPGPAVMPEASPDAALPAPDAIKPASSSSAPPASVPIVTRGDPPSGDGGHGAAAHNAAAHDDDESADGPSLPEPAPESALSAPSELDPSDGTDTGDDDSRAAENNPPLTDPSGNPVGNAQDYQNEQVDAPAMVLMAPPYYGPRQPINGYP